MVKGDALPIIGEHERSADLVFEITSKGIGMAVVVDRNGRHKGVVTDADIRRLLLRRERLGDLSVAECVARSRRGDESPRRPTCMARRHPGRWPSTACGRCKPMKSRS